SFQMLIFAVLKTPRKSLPSPVYVVYSFQMFIFAVLKTPDADIQEAEFELCIAFKCLSLLY
ncbi:MAG: hypothetical protein LBF17_00060, partial [Mediterranea sp.]|nr:hypothetical protein [Mediterranea sp.]